MEALVAVWIIFFISIAGVLFSGVLTYKEMSIKSCDKGGCGIKIFGLPTCLYGFIMYLVVLIVCAVTLFL